MRQATLAAIAVSVLLAVRADARPGTIALVVGGSGDVEVEVLEWGRGERAPVVARAGAQGAVELPPGDYALRLSGTDYRYGPVRLGDATAARVALAHVAVVASGSAPTFFFALDRATGSVAARIAADGRRRAILPGSFDLARDLSETTAPLEIAPGDEKVVTCGALALEVPGTAEDFGASIVSEPGHRVAARARFSRGPEPLLPGTYSVIRDGSGIFSPPVTVEPGAVSRLRCGALRVLALGSAEIDYEVFTSALVPALTARTSDGSQLLLPGEYRIASRAHVRAAREAGRDARALLAGAAFVVAPGRTTTFWVSPAGAFVGADEGGEVPVRLATSARGFALSGAPLAVTVELAEPCSVSLRAEAVGGATLAVAPVESARAPALVTSLALPGGVADETAFTVAVEARTASGAVLRGRSLPALAVRPRVGAVTAPGVAARTATTIELRWPTVAGAAGYRVYRAGSSRPIHGERSLAEARFLDAGLGAGRAYEYAICAVDPRGVEGPRTTIAASTTAGE